MMAVVLHLLDGWDDDEEELTFEVTIRRRRSADGRPTIMQCPDLAPLSHAIAADLEEVVGTYVGTCDVECRAISPAARATAPSQSACADVAARWQPRDPFAHSARGEHMRAHPIHCSRTTLSFA